VLILLEEHSLVPGTSQFRSKRSDWQVFRCLQELGHETAVTEYTTVPNLMAAIERAKPDVVFNLTDAANGDRRKDAHICALLELIGIPYTGAGPRGLMLARDKATSKIIASRAGFTVPRFLVIPPGVLQVPTKLPFPLVVKPRFGDASEGISGASLVATGRRLADRIMYLRSRGCDDIICEEYISGRELFVGVLNDRIVRPKEFVLNRELRGAPRLLTNAFKRDPKYRRKWGVHAVFSRLNKTQLAALAKVVHQTSVALETRDYARFDLILTPNDGWVFLEANPNPGLASPGTNWMGTWDSVDYQAMIADIIHRAIARVRSKTRQAVA
jgi:D-alanine-D-alanine ligase